MAKTIQTQLLGRLVKLGWSLDMVSEWMRKQHTETGKSYAEIKKPDNLKVIGRDDYSRYAKKLGRIRSVYRDGEIICYTVEVEGDLIELTPSQFNLIADEASMPNA